MNYAEAIEFLYDLRLFGTRLGLENTFRLAALVGNPQDRLRFVHIAGTNGKGSTCAMLESVYRHSGRKTGLFTSPHLISFTERIQVNRVNIPQNEVARLTGVIQDRLGGSDLERWPFRPTFFEFITIMALLFFEQEKCDIVIWETGMGGRLDATNIVRPLASVITNIQLDHQQWLGTSLAEIAREKAGIIKRDVPVITTEEKDEALEVIRAKAAVEHARLVTATPDRKSIPPLALSGDHQHKNAALVLATVAELMPHLPVLPTEIKEGLNSVIWLGRLQLLTLPRGKILLDGAHNPDGAETLAAALKLHFAGEKITLVLGLFKDKAWQQMCDSLVPLASRVLLVPVQSDRTADPRIVADYCQVRFLQSEFVTVDSLHSAIEQAIGAQLTVITGSLHLIGEAMEILGLSVGESQRELNEWDASRVKAG